MLPLNVLLKVIFPTFSTEIFLRRIKKFDLRLHLMFEFNYKKMFMPSNENCIILKRRKIFHINIFVLPEDNEVMVTVRIFHKVVFPKVYKQRIVRNACSRSTINSPKKILYEKESELCKYSQRRNVYSPRMCITLDLFIISDLSKNKLPSQCIGNNRIY